MLVPQTQRPQLEALGSVESPGSASSLRTSWDVAGIAWCLERLTCVGCAALVSGRLR